MKTAIKEREINNKIQMSDGIFGISLHLWEFMPTNISCKSMLVEVKTKFQIEIEKDNKRINEIYDKLKKEKIKNDN